MLEGIFVIYLNISQFDLICLFLGMLKLKLYKIYCCVLGGYLFQLFKTKYLFNYYPEYLKYV